MIVSHKHRYIFLKTRKTAGTSLEIELSKHCGPDDIITPISEEDERATVGGRAPQHFHYPVSKMTPRNIARWAIKGKRRRAYNHMTAPEVRHLVGQAVWDSYFIFAVERNPWDMAVSLYHWRTRATPGITFNEFLDSGGAQRIRQNYDIYSIDGAPAADLVIRYESLQRTLEDERVRLGLPAGFALGRVKGGIRPDRRPYTDTLTLAQADKIAALADRSIAALGYAF